MNLFAIDLLGPRDAAPTGRGGGNGGDLFADLLRGAASPADAPAPADAPRPERPERPEAAEGPDRSDGPDRTGGLEKAEAAERPEPQTETDPTEEDAAVAKDEASGEDSGKVADGDEGKPEDTAAADEQTPPSETGPEDGAPAKQGTAAAAIVAAEIGAAMVTAHSNSEVAQTVVPLIASGAPRTPGVIGEAARTTALGVTGEGAPQGARIALSTGQAAPAQGQPTANGQAALGQLPAQVTVTQEGQPLVSRPAAALAPQAGVAAMEEEGQATSTAQATAAGTQSKPAAGPLAPATLQGLAAEEALASTAAKGDGASQTRPASQGPSADVLATAATGGDARAAAFVQQAGAPQQAGTPQQAAVQAPRPAAEVPAPFEQVAVHLQKAAHKGLDRILIQLKPAHLGRIGVQLEVGPDGRVSAVIAADRPETLHLLQRDARGLERALQDAGLHTDSGSLSFNLNGRDRDETPQPVAPGGVPLADDLADPDEPDDRLAALAAHRTWASAREGGIDIHV